MSIGADRASRHGRGSIATPRRAKTLSATSISSRTATEPAAWRARTATRLSRLRLGLSAVRNR